MHCLISFLFAGKSILASLRELDPVDRIFDRPARYMCHTSLQVAFRCGATARELADALEVVLIPFELVRKLRLLMNTVP